MSKSQYKPLGFREFLIGDLFDVKGTNQVFQNDELDVYDNQTDIYNVPYVVRKDGDNGIKGYVDGSLVHSDDLNQGNVITFAQDTFVSYYQPYPFITGNKIKILIFKDGDLSFNLSQWFVSGINKLIKGLSWGTSSTVASIKELTIQLPVLANNQPDYEYMDYFVEELKHKYVEELDAWWSQAGFASLSDTLLTNNDRNVLNKYQQAQFNQVPLSDMFNIINDKVKITDADFDKYPEVLAQTANNGVAHSKFGQPSLLKGLTIGMRGSFNTYMHDSPFIIGPNVAGLQLKQSTRDDEAIYLYVSANLNKQYARFSGYTNYPTFTKLKNEVEITVPMTNDDQPDYDLISQYMQVMKKLTIQTHRAWLDEQLAEYQSLI